MSLGLGSGLIYFYNLAGGILTNCWASITGIDKYTAVDGDCIDVIDGYALVPDAGYDIIDKYI